MSFLQYYESGSLGFSRDFAVQLIECLITNTSARGFESSSAGEWRCKIESFSNWLTRLRRPLLLTEVELASTGCGEM